MTKSLTKSLTDLLALTDTISKPHNTTQSLSDSLPLTDAISATGSITKSLTDSLPLTDTINTSGSITKSLIESLPISDSINFAGGIIIEARDQNNNPISNAVYAVSPNPNGSNTPETVVDGGINDHDGRITAMRVTWCHLDLTPLLTGIPSGYNVLGNSTIYSNPTNPNGTSIFRLVPIATSLTTLPPK